MSGFSKSLRWFRDSVGELGLRVLMLPSARSLELRSAALRILGLQGIRSAGMCGWARLWLQHLMENPWRVRVNLRVLDLFPTNKIYGPGLHFEARNPSLTGKAWQGVFLEHA